MKCHCSQSNLSQHQHPEFEMRRDVKDESRSLTSQFGTVDEQHSGSSPTNRNKQNSILVVNGQRNIKCRIFFLQSKISPFYPIHSACSQDTIDTEVRYTSTTSSDSVHH